jgi:hypothetical protein
MQACHFCYFFDIIWRSLNLPLSTRLRPAYPIDDFHFTTSVWILFLFTVLGYGRGLGEPEGRIACSPTTHDGDDIAWRLEALRQSIGRHSYRMKSPYIFKKMTGYMRKLVIMLIAGEAPHEVTRPETSNEGDNSRMGISGTPSQESESMDAARQARPRVGMGPWPLDPSGKRWYDQL